VLRPFPGEKELRAEDTNQILFPGKVRYQEIKMTALVKGFVSSINILSEWSGKILMWLMLPLTIMVFGEVCLRYFFRSPTVWTSELCSFIFGAASLLGGAYILRHDGHIRMDIIRSRMSAKSRAILDTLTLMFTFLFCFVLAWKGFFNAWDATLIRETSGTTWDPAYWPYTWMLPIGAFLLLLQALAILLNNLHILITGKDL
jgi:TRAP-type mannitol/chloroaromatic compound transport system permease small subunit